MEINVSFIHMIYIYTMRTKITQTFLIKKGSGHNSTDLNKMQPHETSFLVSIIQDSPADLIFVFYNQFYCMRSLNHQCLIAFQINHEHQMQASLYKHRCLFCSIQWLIEAGYRYPDGLVVFGHNSNRFHTVFCNVTIQTTL